MTAIDLEYDAVLRYLSDTKSDVVDGQYFFTLGTHMSASRPWRVVLCATGMGNIEAALKTAAAVHAYAPDLVFLVGIAGSLKDNVHIGDVVAARCVQYYEAAKIGASVQARPQIRNSPEWLVELANHVKRENVWQDRIGRPFTRKERPRAFVAAIASGEKVQANIEAAEYEYLKTHYGEAHAVEMEGYGVLRALRSPEGIPGIVIRGVSDRVQDKSQAGEEGLQESAAAHAAAFAFEVLAEGDRSGLWEERMGVVRQVAVPRPVGAPVPYHRSPHFGGRDREMEELRAGSSEAGSFVIVVGMSGVGKTQLVTEFALDQRDIGADVYWLAPDSDASLAEGLAAIGGSEPLEEGAESGELLQSALQRIAGARDPLVVLDNAPLTDSLAELVRKLQVVHARVVVTSQHQGWRALGQVLDIDVLKREDAVELLRRRSGRPTDAGLTELAEVVGDLPLALEQAAAYLEITGIGPTEYAAMLTEHGARVLAERAPSDQYGRTLGAAWDVAMMEVAKESGNAKGIISTLSLLAGTPVPRWLLGGEPIEGLDRTLLPLMPRIEINDALGVLRRLSLVRLTEDSVTVHALVSAHIRGTFDDDELLSYARFAVVLLLRAFPDDLNDAENWRRASVLAPHVSEILPLAERLGVDISDTLILRAKLADWYRAQGQYGEAVPLLEEALRLSIAVHGERSLWALRERLNLAVVLRGMGQQERAIGLLREAAEIAGEQEPSQEQVWITAMVKFNLGAALFNEGPEGALEALEVHMEALELAGSLRATPLARRAQRLSIRIQSETGEGLVRIGMMAEGQRDRSLIDQGIGLLRDALAAQQEVLGPESGDIAWTEARLALALILSGEEAEAGELADHARQVSSQLDEGNAIRGHVERILGEADL